MVADAKTKPKKKEKKDTELTTSRQRQLAGLKMWEPGQSGNPKGRPKGSRVKFGEAFISDMQDAWEKQGAAVIQRVIEEDPAAFLRSAVSILPKQHEVNINKFDDFDENQLKNAFASALAEASKLGIHAPTIDHEPGTPGGADQESEAKPAKKIQTLQ